MDVRSKKIKDEQSITKARTFTWRFEGPKDFHTDSPCCSWISIRSIFALEASNRWEIKAINLKTAFLQGEQIKQTVYLWPSKEANKIKIWKLWKCVYGLADASRYWYLRERELIKLGANVSSVDTGVFYWKENSRLELLACHVDNMIWGGDEMFETNIIIKLKHTFQFECEEIVAFTYTGIELVQDSDLGISINQNNYINSIKKTVPLTDWTKDKKFLYPMKRRSCTKVQSVS